LPTLKAADSEQRLAREQLERKKLPAPFKQKKLGLSMMRLQREQGTGTAVAANL
jgi:hypothetical protein